MRSVRLNSLLLDLEDPSEGTDQIDAARVVDGATLQDFAFEVRAVGAGTSVDARIETSFDDGENWVTWFVFTQLTGAGAIAKSPPQSISAATDLLRHPGGLIRAAVDIVGAGYTSVRVRMSANPLR